MFCDQDIFPFSATLSLSPPWQILYSMIYAVIMSMCRWVSAKHPATFWKQTKNQHDFQTPTFKTWLRQNLTANRQHNNKLTKMTSQRSKKPHRWSEIMMAALTTLHWWVKKLWQHLLLYTDEWKNDGSTHYFTLMNKRMHQCFLLYLLKFSSVPMLKLRSKVQCRFLILFFTKQSLLDRLCWMAFCSNTGDTVEDFNQLANHCSQT